MNYYQYLYLYPKYLNEENLYILNEMYFGKTPRIKLLEKLCQLYIDSFEREIDNNELLKFETIINQAMNKLYYNRNLINSTFYTNKEQRLNWLDNIQIKIIRLMEQLIGIIFGIAKVNIFFYKDFDDYDNMAIFHTFIERESNIKNLNNKGLEIKDVNGNYLSYDFIKKNIIVKNTGISINMNKCPLYIKLYFSKVMHENNSVSNIISTILHEIGHFFSYLILPINKYILQYINFDFKNKYLSYREIDKYIKIIKDNKELFGITSEEIQKLEYDSENIIKWKTIYKIADRINEKFADQFVSLYGYGPNLANKFLFTDNLYKNFAQSSGTDKISNKNYLDPKKITNNIDNLSDLDEHPMPIHRIQSQILQLQSDLKNPRLSLSKKKQIEQDIKNIQQQLHDYNHNIKRLEKLISFTDEDIIKEEIKMIDITISFMQKDINNLTRTINKYEMWLKKKSNTDKKITIMQKNKEWCENNVKKLKKQILELEEKKKKILFDKTTRNKIISQKREKINKQINEIKFKNKKDIKIFKQKGTKNWMYEKDSYIDPYDISIEMNRLYDDTKFRNSRRITDLFNNYNDVWFSIEAQKYFQNIIQDAKETSNIDENKIKKFILLKYKYYLERPFFQHKKLQQTLNNIFENEKIQIKKAIESYFDKFDNIPDCGFGKISYGMEYIFIKELIENISENNIEKNMKKLKQAVFSK